MIPKAQNVQVSDTTKKHKGQKAGKQTNHIANISIMLPQLPNMDNTKEE
jgi:hypothetical protein